MPYAKKYSNKKKSRKNRNYIRYRPVQNIMPDSHVVKLRYVQQLTLDATTGVNSRNLFRCNSIFDPDYSGTGHQPLGRDQFTPFYDHYTVIGAKCSVHFISTSDGFTAPQMVGIHVQDSVNNIPDPQTLMEQTNAGYKVLTGTSAQQTAKISKGFSAKKFFGLQSVKDNRGLIGAQQEANPTEQAYFNVFTSALDDTQNPSQVKTIVTIEYTVLYTERKDVLTS